MEEVGITNPGTVNKEVDGNYCLSWCPWKPQVSSMIVVGCEKKNVPKPNPHNKWIPFEVLYGHDVLFIMLVWHLIWEDSLRSYYLIATASKDHKVG
ncbi:21895_t:CDS:2, partial [Gigaspora rosea]